MHKLMFRHQPLPHLPRRQAGFSLVELMIVIAISLALVAIAMTWWQAESKRQARAELMEIQAIEMATLSRALEQYLDSGVTLPSSGVFDVDIAALEAAQYLPELYLREDAVSPPVSPLGQVYVLRGIRQGDRYRGLVMPVGPASDAQMSRYGIKADDQDLFSHAMGVMRKMGSAHYAAAAVIEPGSTVTHAASGFTSDYSALLGAPAGAGAVVGLAGFAEHSPFRDIIASIELGEGGGGGPVGGGGAEDQSNRFCYLSVGESCPARYETVFDYEVCSRWGKSHEEGGEPLNATVRTAAGDLTIRREKKLTVGEQNGYFYNGGPVPNYTYQLVTYSEYDYYGEETWYDITSKCTATNGPLAGQSITIRAVVPPSDWPNPGNYCQQTVRTIPPLSLAEDPSIQKELSAAQWGILFHDTWTMGVWAETRKPPPPSIDSVRITEVPVPACLASSPYAQPTPFWSSPGQYHNGTSTVLAGTTAMPSLSPISQGTGYRMRVHSRSTWHEKLEYQGAVYADTLCEEEQIARGTNATLFVSLPVADRVTVNLCPEPGTGTRTQRLLARPAGSGTRIGVCCSRD